MKNYEDLYIGTADDTNIAQVWEAKGRALEALNRTSEANESYAMAAKFDHEDYGTSPEDIAHQKEEQRNLECARNTGNIFGCTN